MKLACIFYILDHGVTVTQQFLELLFLVRIRVIQQIYDKMKKLGYREMLRDRCPKMVDFALKWCNAKERWINHAYNQFIKVFVSKKEKNHTTRIILGIAKYYREFEFDKSIDWENLTEEEKTYWKWVSEYVRWFMKDFAYAENAYVISRSRGKDEFDCKVELIKNYLQSKLPTDKDDEEIKAKKLKETNKFADYIVKCIKTIHKDV